jgi:hypothetical protein
MGIRDRDYMKRPSGDDGDDARPSGSKLDAFFSEFLSRHPRLLLVLLLVLAAAILVAVIMAKISSGGN